jgi:predicted SnoaL-like aldol condensation-catalyzing enzyme
MVTQKWETCFCFPRPIPALFEKASQLHASITNRITQGNYVIAQEVVTGSPGAKEFTAVAIYEVKDGQIVNVWFCGNGSDDAADCVP